ncbi:SIMPL domain-containing protein [Bacillaceae bacterium S4-13-58]
MYPYQNYYQSYPSNQRSYPRPNRNQQDQTIKVIGKGALSIPPDLVIITLGVETTNRNVEEAQQQNSMRMNRMLESLKSMGITEEHIETILYNMEPIYEFLEGKREFKGYRFTHLVEIKIKETTRAGEIIDAATKSGANRVNDIRFEVSEPSKYYREALQQATIDATDKAQAIASSYRVTLQTTPIWIEEKEPDIVRPFYQSMAVKETTPIQEGKVTISAAVQALYFYDY